MRRQFWVAAASAAAAIGAWPAAAVNVEDYEVPYFGIGADAVATDSARGADDGFGFHLSLGVPMRAPRNALELRYFDAGYGRSDGKDNYQSGLFVDYVRDFGPLGWGTPWHGGLKPFAAAGIGFIQEDVAGDKHLELGLSLGGGALLPLGWNGWALRLDARVQPQANSQSVPGEDYLVDYVVGLALQLPMTWFYDRPVAVREAECPLAVVDPDTGRRDCVTDSDGDGVDDPRDECPGTPDGARVEARGCLRVLKVVDSDGDGVANDEDQCPDTQGGLEVDDDGCVVSQRTAVKGITFLPNSAQLTAEGRETLDRLAPSLRDQRDVSVEIAGHTDAVGSEAFNTMLSQQRADAVRLYLIGKGVDERRLTAVGYGELEPVASNDTDEGRKANRRVEFRISAH